MKLNGTLSLWTPVALVFVLRLPDLFVPYYNSDELTNSLFANMILDGRLTLLDFLGNTYLLTHYFYAAVTWLFGRHTLFPVYAVNLVWCGATAAVFYAAGKELTGRKEGGFWAGIFYATASVCFMSKDFRAVISESLSLLPLTIAALFFIRASKRDSLSLFFGAGFFAGVGGLFKAPAAILVFVIGLSLFFRPSGVKPGAFVAAGCGFAAAIFGPLLFIASPVEGFSRMVERVQRINKYYIQSYEDLPAVYWWTKYLIRTLLVAVSCPLVWHLAFKTVRGAVTAGGKGPASGRKDLVLFLFFWFLASWFVVSIGKRIFYHYFIFLIPPLSLLASPSMLTLAASLKKLSFPARRARTILVGAALLIPPAGYAIEAMIGLSPARPRLDALIRYVEDNTKTGERIFIWGSIPQVYLFAKRDPASTFFWSDMLAGFSPASPAMEYARVTGKQPDLGEAIVMDLLVSPAEKNEPAPLTREPIHPVSDAELLSTREVFEQIGHPFWKKTFSDFFNRPPVLFLDTQPTGLRGFGRFPVEKYLLLKKFLNDYYDFETVVENTVIYRLRRQGRQPNGP